MKSKKPTSPPARRSPASSSGRTLDEGRAVVLDFVQSRIEAFNAEQGGGVAIARTLMATRYCIRTPACRMRGSPRDTGDRFEVLYWSPFRERWLPVGPLGGMVLKLLDACEFVANDPMDCFWR